MTTARYASRPLAKSVSSDRAAGLWTTLSVWLRRSRTRRQLAELPPYLLKDVGLNEADRYQEVSKPFWQQ